MEIRSIRILCALLEKRIRLSRCTELLLERIGVVPDDGLSRIARLRKLTPGQLASLCRDCPYNTLPPDTGL